MDARPPGRADWPPRPEYVRSRAAEAACGVCGRGVLDARSLTAAARGGRAVMLCDAHARAGDVTAPPAADPTSDAYFARAPDV